LLPLPLPTPKGVSVNFTLPEAAGFSCESIQNPSAKISCKINVLGLLFKK
jgi:hypothetical protein